MQVENQIPAPTRCRPERLLFPSGVQNVHVVGLCGSGIRGIVQILRERGLKVSGSELLDSPVLEKFRLTGMDCRVGHSSGNLAQDTNLVLISAAVQDSNPEVQAAVTRRIPVLKYAQVLGRLMAEKNGIAIAGTHGKTTTTAMVSLILTEAGLDPTFVIGGEYPALGGSSHLGKGEFFVAEACEFDRSFLNLQPKMSIVTNIEEDHLDYFKSLKEIQGAFADFVSLLPEDGFLVLNRDDPNSSYLSEFCRSAVGTFSLRAKGADWWAEEILPESGGSCFSMVSQSGEQTRVRLRVPGLHNVSNALAATAVCRRAGVPLETISAVIERFTGVRRRFDILCRKKVFVIDDYAHHPTEIHMVLRAARQSMPDRRLVAVFQPHQHSRLRMFRDRFADVLSRFDMVFVTEVFRARDKEEDVRTVHSDSLVETMRYNNPDGLISYTPTFDDVLQSLRRNVNAGDAVIFLGAGSITDLARRYAEEVSGDAE